MSTKRDRGGEPGDGREFRGNDGNQQARDRGETGRYEDEASTESGAFGAGGGRGGIRGREDDPRRVKRQVHQEGEEPLPYDHSQKEWLGTDSDDTSPDEERDANRDADRDAGPGRRS